MNLLRYRVWYLADRAHHRRVIHIRYMHHSYWIGEVCFIYVTCIICVCDVLCVCWMCSMCTMYVSCIRMNECMVRYAVPSGFGFIIRGALEGFYYWLIDCLLCKVHYYDLQNYRMWEWDATLRISSEEEDEPLRKLITSLGWAAVEWGDPRPLKSTV